MKFFRVEAPQPPPSGEFYILVGGFLLLLSVALHGQVAWPSRLFFIVLFVLILAGLATWITTLLTEAENVRPQLPPLRVPKPGPFHFGLGGLLLGVVTLFFAAGFTILPFAHEYDSSGQEIRQSAVLTAFCCGVIALTFRGWYEQRHGRVAECLAAWTGAVVLVILADYECTEPRWLVTAFALIVLTGGILTHRRWLIWAREVIAEHQAFVQAQADGQAPVELPE
jgi:hypothetical protein